VIEKALNVCVENPVHALPLDAHIQRVQRLMRAASGPEPIRKAKEVHLVNLIENGHRGLLNKLVLQRRDA
jgi:endonuclease III